MAQNWKKEAARRGYWYRKLKKMAHDQFLEIIILKQELQLHLINRQFYFEMGKLQGLKEVNKVLSEKEVIRTKYLDYIRKYNKLKQENEVLVHKIGTILEKANDDKEEVKRPSKRAKKISENVNTPQIAIKTISEKCLSPSITEAEIQVLEHLRTMEPTQRKPRQKRKKKKPIDQNLLDLLD